MMGHKAGHSLAEPMLVVTEEVLALDINPNSIFLYFLRYFYNAGGDSSEGCRAIVFP